MTNKQQYQSIVEQLPLFFQPWWLDVVCEGDWDVALLHDQNNIIAVWPYQIEKKMGFKIIRNPLLTAYLGPLFLCGYSDEAMQLLWLQIPKSDMFQFSCLPQMPYSDFFVDKGMNQTHKVTYRIDLSLSEQEIWQQIFPKRKNDIRKAEQDLHITKNEFNCQQFVSFHQRTFDEKGKKYPYSVSLLEKLTKLAAQHQSSLSYAAFDQQNNCLGQIWLTYDQQTMYYLLSATSANTHRGAIALMIWEAIIEAKKMGLCVFDFEGSMDKGIANFFQRFGGVKINYNDFTMTNSSLWKLKQKILG